MPLPFLCALGAGLFLTLRSRGIQFRALGLLWRLLRHDQAPGAGVVTPRQALLTAMSTTLGVGNVVGPVVAIGFGGPGALLCYVLASVLGGATLFAEVSLAMRHRYQDAQGQLHGGPMPYLRKLLPGLAPVYAVACALLLLGWCGSNAHTIAAVLAGEGVPRLATGGALAAAVFVFLLGGIQRIARLNDKLVPLMTVLYCAGTGWILATHASQLPAAVVLVWRSFWQPQAVAYGVGAHTTLQVLRWGLARALQANEAGVGTATVPHSMAQAEGIGQQAVLAMASVYFNGLICLLTGMTVLVGGGSMLQADTVFDVSLLSRIFTQHLSGAGAHVLGLSIFLFCFGTILGNGFNGGHCLASVCGRRSAAAYAAASSLAVFAGCLFDLRTAWTVIDYLIAPVVVINAIAVSVLAARGQVDFTLPQASPTAKRPQGSAA